MKSEYEEHEQFMRDCELQEKQERLLFQAQCAELEAGILEDCKPRQDSKMGRFSRRTPSWARSVLTAQRKRQAHAALMSLRNAFAATRSAGLLARMRTMARAVAGHRSTGTQRGAQARSAARSGDSNSADGDPDPADTVINDPYSPINTNTLTRPINRIFRKAILAQRQGLEENNPRVYNWYLARSLAEIERAFRSAFFKKVTLTSDILDLIPAAAFRLFSDLCSTHDFDKNPNPVASWLIFNKCPRDTQKLYAYVRGGIFRDPAASHKTADADVYAVAKGLVDTAAGAAVAQEWVPDERYAIAPSAETFEGVTIDHLPAGLRTKPVKVTVKGKGKGKVCQMIGFDQVLSAADDDDLEDTGASKALMGYTTPDETPDHMGLKDQYFNEDGTYDYARERADAARAGTVARQIVLYVTRQADQDAAAREAALTLTRQGAFGNQVLQLLTKDRENREVCSKIQAAAKFAPVEALFQPKPQKILDDDLEDLAKWDLDALAACRDMHLDALREKHGYPHKGNLLSALLTRAANKKGKFSPEIQQVASTLLGNKGKGDAA